jgi:CRISPR-associated protein Csx17
VGYDSASSEEPMKGEIWLPLWQNAVSLRELRRLMSEGRIDWRGRHARTGLDFAKAASTLGVDRGIGAFSRQVVVERFGQSSVAIAAGRVEVGAGASQRVLPLAELDGWLNRVRDAKDVPLGISRALRRVDQAAYAVTLPGIRRSPGSLARVLVETALLEQLVARARTLRARADIRPVSGLSARRWLRSLAEDLSAAGRTRELRLAAALASCRDLPGPGSVVPGSSRGAASGVPGTLREMLCPVSRQDSGDLQWSDTALVEGLGSLPIVALLAEVHARRAVDLLAAKKRQSGEEGGGSERGRQSSAGLPTRFSTSTPCALSDISALTRGAIDEQLLSDLLMGCMLLDWRESPLLEPGGKETDDGLIPPSLAVTAPFFVSQPLRSRRSAASIGEEEDGPSWTLVPEPEWPILLSSGRADVVVNRALARLRIAGHDPVLRSGDVRALPGEAVRLGAALLVPMAAADGRLLLRRVCPPDELSKRNHQPMTEEVDDAQS